MHLGASEVIAAGLSLLQRANAAPAAFNVSLEEAEGEREGCFTIEEIHQVTNDLSDELAYAHA